MFSVCWSLSTMLDFGDPFRKHEMKCRYSQKPPIPLGAIGSASGVLLIFTMLEIPDDVFSPFFAKSREKGIELAVFVSYRVPKILIGDPGRFRQIITNLVENLIKMDHL